jgi:hypothetical protein
MHAISTVESMEVGTFIPHAGVLSPKYDKLKYLHGNIFLEVRLGTCVENWAEQKT